MGFDDAPIDVLYWSDYLCPYCQKFSINIHPKLVKNEVKKKRARFVFLELPNIGKNSRPAALFAKAVWRTVANDDPNRYWEWHHAVFGQQGSAGSGWADRSELLDITKSVGIATDAVTTNLDGHRRRFERTITEEIDAADQASVPATPAFYFYNRQTGDSKTIFGAQPYSQYRSMIQSLIE